MIPGRQVPSTSAINQALLPSAACGVAVNPTMAQCLCSGVFASDHASGRVWWGSRWSCFVQGKLRQMEAILNHLHKYEHEVQTES